ncbi:Pre-rRNA-processing protein ESF2 [Linum grandiflorum]
MMDAEEFGANLMNSKADGSSNAGKGKSSSRLKTKKKRRAHEVEVMEVEKDDNGDNIGEGVDVEASCTRLNKKKRMAKTETGEVKKGSKKKQRGEETEGNEKEENVVDEDGSLEEEEPRAEVRELLEESNPELITDVTTDSMSSEHQSLVDEENEKKKKKKEKKRRLAEEAAKARRLGICYLSRIPPNMDHVILRHVLSQYAKIQRIYLVPEDKTPMESQRKAAKHKRQSFSEGWVEFSDKGVAKRVANMLNGEQMGGKKRSQFYYDTWNIKYLSKFKWDDLTEEIAVKRATREQKLALELSTAKRERDFYLKKVERSIALTNIEERLKKKQKVPDPPKINRFQQKKPVADKTKETKSNISKDFLSEVFGGSG